MRSGEAIGELLEHLNTRPFKKLEGSRQSLFDGLDRPALHALPERPYVYAEWKKARVGIDYHVEMGRHYYSVPHTYARKQIDLRLTERTLECFFRGERIASHRRSLRQGHHTTVKAHMPESHRHYADWTPDRLIDWAAKTGEATAELTRKIIASRAHPQQGYRTCLGILRLGEAHGTERLEQAARRALSIGALSYKSVASILKHGLETRPLPSSEQALAEHSIEHTNIRGADYYAAEARRPSHHLIDPKQSYEC